MENQDKLSAEATMHVLRAHYINCANFWSQTHPSFKDTGYTDDEVSALSLHDIFICKHNPFSPNGGTLDENARIRFLSEGGWYAHYNGVYARIQNSLIEHRVKLNDKSLENTFERVVADSIMDTHGYVVWSFYAKGATCSGTSLSEWYGEYFHHRFPHNEEAIRHWVASCGIGDDGKFVYTLHHHILNV